jgi:hypothetical protein
VAAPKLGDYDGDGTVTAADYTVWRNTFGATANLAADGVGDKVIGAGDYEVWKSRFGTTLGSGTAAASHAVPEPSGIALFASCLLLGSRCSRRRD